MKIESGKTKRECVAGFRESLSGWFNLFDERFTGWYLFGLFTVTYHRDREYVYRWNPMVKIAGIARKSNGKTVIHYMRFYGLTFPTSIISYFIITLILMLLKNPDVPIFEKGIWQALFWVYLFVLLVPGTIIFLYSFFSEAGRESAHELDERLARISIKYDERNE